MCPARTFNKFSGSTSFTACTRCALGFYQDEPGEPACKAASCPRGTWGEILPNCTSNLNMYMLVCMASKRRRVINTCKMHPYTYSRIRFSLHLSFLFSHLSSLSTSLHPPRLSVFTGTNCAAGKYNPARGRGDPEGCDDCPAGRWSATPGARTLKYCHICKGGTYSNTTGATTKQCSGLCPPGKYSNDGFAQCTKCGQGKYTDHENSTLCLSCTNKMTTLGEGSTMCVCVKTTYMSNNTCVSCPDDVSCDKDGSTLETVALKPGAWRPNNQSDAIYECPVKESCLGGNSTNMYVGMKSI